MGSDTGRKVDKKPISAGILPFRRTPGGLEVYLIHMGGPYWVRRERSWSIPKGIVEQGESPEEAARREFREETGQSPRGKLLDLGKAKSGSKTLHIFAMEDPELSTVIRSNTFRIEWPPGSGNWREYPEADRAAWMPMEEAYRLLVRSQLSFLDRLERLLGSGSDHPSPVRT